MGDDRPGPPTVLEPVVSAPASPPVPDAVPVPPEATPAPRPTFYSELKRRRVFWGLAVYFIIAFGVLQAIDVILPALGFPSWPMTALIIVAIAGLPVAAALGWRFDLQPDGVRREAPPDHVGFLEPPRRWPRVLAIVGLAVVLALVSLAAYLRLAAIGVF